MAGGPKDSSAPSRLTPLQVDLLQAFFAREQRFVLTGGAALAGFYFGHRETEDLDFFGTPGLDLQEAARTLDVACTACAAALEPVQTFPDFRWYLARRVQETCIVDLVIARVPMLDTEKRIVGRLRIDTIREIAANKICTVLGRAQIKDLVDLKFLLASGIDLSAALATPHARTRESIPQRWPGCWIKSPSHRMRDCPGTPTRAHSTNSGACWSRPCNA
jgi:hypothetical protein